MIGLFTAVALFVLRFSLEEGLWETLFIESALFLLIWYLITGLVLCGLAVLAWAGDLGVEGARLRVGIGTPLSWLMGLPRVPVHQLGVVIFLCMRRLALVLGAFFLTEGIRAVGAIFVQDDAYLILGGALLLAGLGMGLGAPLLRRIPKRGSFKKTLGRI